MNIRSKTGSYDNIRIARGLAIERCQQHLAHLHALMHLCGHEEKGLDDNVAEGVLIIMESLQRDLSYSASILQVAE